MLKAGNDKPSYLFMEIAFCWKINLFSFCVQTQAHPISITQYTPLYLSTHIIYLKLQPFVGLFLSSQTSQRLSGETKHLK